jgi:methoxymalonate biosynthesis acyl carrier protein
MTTSTEPLTPEAIQATLLAFLEKRTRQAVSPDLDLFGSGLVSSLFALELLVHVESSFGVTVGGGDLTLDNFRTVYAMTALVQRLASEREAPRVREEPSVREAPQLASGTSRMASSG